MPSDRGISKTTLFLYYSILRGFNLTLPNVAVRAYYRGDSPITWDMSFTIRLPNIIGHEYKSVTGMEFIVTTTWNFQVHSNLFF